MGQDRRGVGPSPAGSATPSERIDGYLAALPADQRSALQALRATIAAAAPEAIEGISYAMPAFRYRGRPLVSYGAASRHLSFYPMSPAVIEANADLLAGFDTSKGTIRFTPGRPLPAEVVEALVRARLAELDPGR